MQEAIDLINSIAVVEAKLSNSPHRISTEITAKIIMIFIKLKF